MKNIKIYQNLLRNVTANFGKGALLFFWLLLVVNDNRITCYKNIKNLNKQSGNVTAILGKGALLNCRVRGIGNRTVAILYLIIMIMMIRMMMIMIMIMILIMMMIMMIVMMIIMM